MKVTDGQAQSGVTLESAVWSDHVYTGWFEGVLWREYKLSVIISTFIR